MKTNPLHKPPLSSSWSRPDLPALADPKEVLQSLHPDLTNRIVKLVHLARNKGLSVMLWEGFRNGERQNALFKKGVTRARAGYSFHNYGLAADLVFIDHHGRPSWDEKHDWQTLGQIGKSLGLVWGGDFRSLKDLGHFEYHPGLSLQDIKRLHQQGGAEKIGESIHDNRK